MKPSKALLEVIALTPEDAVAAEVGGADRLEVVSAIETGGLTPTPDQFEKIRDSVDLPVRVMLRTNAGFRISATEIDDLLGSISILRQAGADAFVLGFLTAGGSLDLEAIGLVVSAIEPSPWTLHHAFDHANDQAAAWDSISGLPGLDCVLSGGIEGDLGRGLGLLCERGGWQSDGLRWLAGGGLAQDFVPSLARVGITMFHIGRGARHDYSWDQPVNPHEVRCWQRLVDSTVGT